MTLENVRDVAIIFVALENIILFILLIFIAWKAFRLMGFFRSKAEEFSILGRTLMQSAQQSAQSANEAVTTVKGSAEFVSDTVVSPVVQVVSAVAGAKSFVSALFRLPSSPRDGGRK